MKKIFNLKENRKRQSDCPYLEHSESRRGKKCLSEEKTTYRTNGLTQGSISPEVTMVEGYKAMGINSYRLAITDHGTLGLLK